jgi:hypothetical protein
MTRSSGVNHTVFEWYFVFYDPSLSVYDGRLTWTSHTDLVRHWDWALCRIEMSLLGIR